jgi:hypothetical protein
MGPSISRAGRPASRIIRRHSRCRANRFKGATCAGCRDRRRPRGPRSPRRHAMRRRSSRPNLPRPPAARCRSMRRAGRSPTIFPTTPCCRPAAPNLLIRATRRPITRRSIRHRRSAPCPRSGRCAVRTRVLRSCRRR